MTTRFAAPIATNPRVAVSAFAADAAAGLHSQMREAHEAAAFAWRRHQMTHGARNDALSKELFQATYALAQAQERADPLRMNKGGEALEAAVEMAILARDSRE